LDLSIPYITVISDDGFLLLHRLPQNDLHSIPFPPVGFAEFSDQSQGIRFRGKGVHMQHLYGFTLGHRIKFNLFQQTLISSLRARIQFHPFRSRILACGFTAGTLIRFAEYLWALQKLQDG